MVTCRDVLNLKMDGVGADCRGTGPGPVVTWTYLVQTRSYEDHMNQGTLILETSVQNKRTGDYLYNLLFGYDINEKYVEKISGQFGLYCGGS